MASGDSGYSETFKRIESEAMGYKDIAIIMQRLGESAFFEAMYECIYNIFSNEHDFTMRNLTEMQAQNKSEGIQLQHIYQFNACIFRNNLQLILKLLIDDISVKFSNTPLNFLSAPQQQQQPPSTSIQLSPASNTTPRPPVELQSIQTLKMHLNNNNNGAASNNNTNKIQDESSNYQYIQQQEEQSNLPQQADFSPKFERNTKDKQIQNDQQHLNHPTDLIDPQQSLSKTIQNKNNMQNISNSNKSNEESNLIKPNNILGKAMAVTNLNQNLTYLSANHPEIQLSLNQLEHIAKLNGRSNSQASLMQQIQTDQYKLVNFSQHLGQVSPSIVYPISHVKTQSCSDFDSQKKKTTKIDRFSAKILSNLKNKNQIKNDSKLDNNKDNCMNSNQKTQPSQLNKQTQDVNAFEISDKDNNYSSNNSQHQIQQQSEKSNNQNNTSNPAFNNPIQQIDNSLRNSVGISDSPQRHKSQAQLRFYQQSLINNMSGYSHSSPVRPISGDPNISLQNPRRNQSSVNSNNIHNNSSYYSNGHQISQGGVNSSGFSFSSPVAEGANENGNPLSSSMAVLSSTSKVYLPYSEFSYTTGGKFSRSERKLHEKTDNPGVGDYEQQDKQIHVQSSKTVFGKEEKKTIFQKKADYKATMFYPSYHFVAKSVSKH